MLVLSRENYRRFFPEDTVPAYQLDESVNLVFNVPGRSGNFLKDSTIRNAIWFGKGKASFLEDGIGTNVEVIKNGSNAFILPGCPDNSNLKCSPFYESPRIWQLYLGHYHTTEAVETRILCAKVWEIMKVYIKTSVSQDPEFLNRRFGDWGTLEEQFKSIMETLKIYEAQEPRITISHLNYGGEMTAFNIEIKAGWVEKEFVLIGPGNEVPFFEVTQ